VDPDPERSAAACRELGAEDGGVLVQRDTYFDASRGRLKLREEENAVPHLVSYLRPNHVGSRESRYRIVPVERLNELKAALSDSLGVVAVVAKHRRLFLWENVRIHLDRVEDLGNFIELEAVAPPDSDLSQEERRVWKLQAELGIRQGDLIALSYCDLSLLAAQ
jgi:adenylate cyclase, class 2